MQRNVPPIPEIDNEYDKVPRFIYNITVKDDVEQVLVYAFNGNPVKERVPIFLCNFGEDDTRYYLPNPADKTNSIEIITAATYRRRQKLLTIQGIVPKDVSRKPWKECQDDDDFINLRTGKHVSNQKVYESEVDLRCKGRTIGETHHKRFCIIRNDGHLIPVSREHNYLKYLTNHQRKEVGLFYPFVKKAEESHVERMKGTMILSFTPETNELENNTLGNENNLMELSTETIIDEQLNNEKQDYDHLRVTDEIKKEIINHCDLVQLTGKKRGCAVASHQQIYHELNGEYFVIDNKKNIPLIPRKEYKDREKTALKEKLRNRNKREAFQLESPRLGKKAAIEKKENNGKEDHSNSQLGVSLKFFHNKRGLIKDLLDQEDTRILDVALKSKIFNTYEQRNNKNGRISPYEPLFQDKSGEFFILNENNQKDFLIKRDKNYKENIRSQLIKKAKKI